MPLLSIDPFETNFNMRKTDSEFCAFKITKQAKNWKLESNLIDQLEISKKTRRFEQ